MITPFPTPIECRPLSHLEQLTGSKRVRSGADLVRLSEVVSSSRTKPCPVVATTVKSATVAAAKPLAAASPPKDLSQGAFRNSPKLRGTAGPLLAPADRERYSDPEEEDKGHKEYPC